MTEFNTIDSIGVTNEIGDNCFSPDILQGQAVGFLQATASVQSTRDYIRAAKETNRPRNWCILMLVLGLAYAGIAAFTLIYAGVPEPYNLINFESSGPTSLVTTSSLTWAPEYVLGIMAGAIALIYILTAIIGGTTYFAFRMFQRFEWTIFVLGYLVHFFAQFSVSMVVLEFNVALLFFFLVIGLPLIAAGSYLLISIDTASGAKWAIGTLVGFAGITAVNVTYIGLAIFGTADVSLANWEIAFVWLHLLGTIAVWANVLAWILAASPLYSGTKTLRDGLDYFVMVHVLILAIFSVAIHLIYNFSVLV